MSFNWGVFWAVLAAILTNRLFGVFGGSLKELLRQQLDVLNEIQTSLSNLEQRENLMIDDKD